MVNRFFAHSIFCFVVASTIFVLTYRYNESKHTIDEMIGEMYKFKNYQNDVNATMYINVTKIVDIALYFANLTICSHSYVDTTEHDAVIIPVKKYIIMNNICPIGIINKYYLRKFENKRV